jgi:hypothetical protein
MAGKAEAQARIVTMTAAVVGPSMELRSEAEAAAMHMVKPYEVNVEPDIPVRQAD